MGRRADAERGKGRRWLGERNGLDARVAWVRELLAKLWDAQERCDEAWMRRVRENQHLSEEELEALPEPPEQAEFDALYAQVRAVIDEDRWPRELYWGEI